MAASYPGTIKTFSTKASGQAIASSHINDLQDEVKAVETQLVTSKLATLTTAPAANNVLTTDESGNPTWGGEWVDWTPTVGIVGTGTAPTFSKVFINRYCVVGKIVHVYGRWWNQTGDTMGSGTGYVTGTLPVPAATITQDRESGHGGATLHTTGDTLIGVYLQSNTFSFELLTWTSIAASEFASTDKGLDFHFTYEAA